METEKRCVICGEPGQAKLNGEFWLCAHHAHELVFATLRAGQPVMEAIKGKPQYLLVPSSTLSKN